jgi:hypothetical protein
MLTLIGRPGSFPIPEGESVDSEGERFVVDSVVVAKDGSWQATAFRAT